MLVSVVGYHADRVSGVSALFGGLASLLPNVYFALRVFGFGGRQKNADTSQLASLDEDQAEKLATLELAALYRAEVGKLVLMGVLLVMAFSLLEPLNAGALAGGFAAVHLGHFVVMFSFNLVVKSPD